MASVNVTADDRAKFLQQDLGEYIELCEKGFQEHKFDCAETGLTIGHAIIKDFLVSRMKDTPQGQQISVNDQDTFTMLAVLAKTNATALTSLKRAKYHEDQTRTSTANLNQFDKIVKDMKDQFDLKVKELEDKGSTQSTSDDIVKGLADLLKVNGPKTQIGGHKPVSEHKAVQQLKSFTGDRSKFREWNGKLLNALAQVDVKKSQSFEDVKQEVGN